MKQVSDYKVVSAGDHKELAVKVCDNIEDGWEPVGGLAFSPESSRFYQALIRYQPNDWVTPKPWVGGPG